MTRLSFAGGTRAMSVDLARGHAAEAPRVLPLGDSNTLGLSNRLPPEAFEGWRGALRGRILEGRHWIDYVGGRSNGGADLQDHDHQGVSGIRATTVLGQAAGIGRAHRPDLVLLMLGTNDALNEGDAAATVPGEILAIMRAIEAASPGAAFLIAALPPIDPEAAGFSKRADADAIRAAINARLPEVAAAARAEGIEARFVPVPDLAEADLYDGIHPTAAGHDKIAAAFARAMAAGLAEGDWGGPRASTKGVRDVAGSEAGDFLRGDRRWNRLDGGGGDDRLEGGPGRDTLTGGEGADVFVWKKPGHGRDRIRDFSPEDRLEFSAAGFGGDLVPGVAPILRAGEDPAPRGHAGQFLYDEERGRLAWDADGAGPAEARLIARLRGAPELGADDFLIV